MPGVRPKVFSVLILFWPHADEVLAHFCMPCSLMCCICHLEMLERNSWWTGNTEQPPPPGPTPKTWSMPWCCYMSQLCWAWCLVLLNPILKDFPVTGSCKRSGTLKPGAQRPFSLATPWTSLQQRWHQPSLTVLDCCLHFQNLVNI